MDFVERMKSARHIRGLTQEQIARQIGVAKSTYAGYEIGNSEPNLRTVQKIISVLKIDANYLFQDTLDKGYENRATPEEMQKLVKRYRLLDEHGQETIDAIFDCEYNRYLKDTEIDTLPPLDVANTGDVIYIYHNDQKASAGSGFMLGDEHMEPWAVIDNELTRRADFCVDVKGASMEPKFHDGDIILVEKTPSVDIGEIGLFVVEGCGYVKRKCEHYLESINQNYPDIVPREGDRVDCMGKVIGILDPSWIVEDPPLKF